uniref:Ligand of Numb protein X 2 n=1 Tax=Magallana gigas TaxID=29159 RepID=A0A8W8NQE1_MAGGI
MSVECYVKPELHSIVLSPYRLLDKLLVVCPNVDYCEEVLPRCELEAHLLHRCRGAVTKCIKSTLGCTFQGPRSALQSHLWECQFRDQDGGKNPVLDGEVSTIEIQRSRADLGISIVGGNDTPLGCIVIQEVFPDWGGGRRWPPDARRSDTGGEWQRRIDQLKKRGKVKGKQLGIKLVGKRIGPGVYILNLVPGSLAALDGRLRPDDRVLEINGTDVSYGSQEQAAQVIQTTEDRVQFVISRCSRPQTPDLIRSTADSGVIHPNYENHRPFASVAGQQGEKLVTVSKEPQETLGISVAGGIDSPRGDTPIYITNINLTGCLGKTRTGQVFSLQKGDILLSINGKSLLGLTHNQAVSLVKQNTEANVICLKIIEGSETSYGQGNFTPTWLFWQKVPSVCQTIKTVTLLRSPSGSLGFSLVGGSDKDTGPSVPVHVKSVVMETPAAKDGRLKCGDILLSVNQHSLVNVTHSLAVDLLKQADGAVTLTAVSWPGTIV